MGRDDLAAVDVGRPAVGANVATLLAPLFPQGVDEVLAALDAFYAFSAGEASGTVYLFSPWPTPDRRPRGWALLDHPCAGREAHPLGMRSDRPPRCSTRATARTRDRHEQGE